MEIFKYVTKKKRIRQLQKRIEELEQLNQNLTQALDTAYEMLYKAKPGLARSMERDFLSTQLAQPLPKPTKRKPGVPKRSLSIAPRADLVLKRN
jgi:TolA-binding protein